MEGVGGGRDGRGKMKPEVDTYTAHTTHRQSITNSLPLLCLGHLAMSMFLQSTAKQLLPTMRALDDCGSSPWPSASTAPKSGLARALLGHHNQSCGTLLSSQICRNILGLFRFPPSSLYRLVIGTESSTVHFWQRGPPRKRASKPASAAASSSASIRASTWSHLSSNDSSAVSTPPISPWYDWLPSWGAGLEKTVDSLCRHQADTTSKARKRPPPPGTCRAPEWNPAIVETMLDLDEQVAEAKMRAGDTARPAREPHATGGHD